MADEQPGGPPGSGGGEPAAVPPGPPTDRSGDVRTRDRLELIATILLSVATVLTAWSAFQAAKWSGVQTLQLNDATAKRAESIKVDNAGGQKQAIDIAFFDNWVEATAEAKEDLAGYHEARFSDELRVAFMAWARLPEDLEDEPESPFEMDEYQIPEFAAAEALLAEGDALAATARESNQRSDNYVLLTVLFAAVLFFAGVSGKFSSLRAQRVMVGLATVLLLVGVALLVTFPVEI